MRLSIGVVNDATSEAFEELAVNSSSSEGGEYDGNHTRICFDIHRHRDRFRPSRNLDFSHEVLTEN